MERDFRLDSIRGLLLVIITIDHMGGVITKLTWQTFGFVSAAEGFIFMSGFVFALFCYKHAQQPKLIMVKSLSRALEIYLYHLAVLFGIALIAFVLPPFVGWWKGWLVTFYDQPLDYFLFGVLLLHHPLYMSILSMYSILLLLSPLVIRQLNAGRYLIVIVISLALWALGQFVDPLKWLTHTLSPESRPGFFNILSWQLLFFLGLSVSHYNLCNPQKKLKALPLLLVVIMLFALLVLFLVRHDGLVLPLNIDVATDISNLAWLRLLNTLVLFSVVALLLTKIPKIYHVPWLSFLGKHSLQVFAFHVVLFYVASPVGWKLQQRFGDVVHVSFVLLCVASLTIPAYIHHKLAARKRA